MKDLEGVEHIDPLMKRCRAGTTNHDDANGLHADCYGAIGYLRERADQGEQILHAIRRAVGLDFNNGVSLLTFIEERWISDEQVAAAWKLVPDIIVEQKGMLVEPALAELGIHRCWGCGGDRTQIDQEGHMKIPCHFCDGIGATRGKNG